MAVERYGSKTDVVVKLILVFFISLLSFSIGTFVGKKFSDNQHKISQLEPLSQEREVASLHPEDGEVKPKDALNDDEIKKLAEEFVGDDEGKKKAKKLDDEIGKDKKEEQETAAPTHANDDAHGTSEFTNEKGDVADFGAKAKPSEAAERVVAGQTADAPPAKSDRATPRIPQSLPKELATSAIGKFTVQIASYPTEAEAQKTAADLKDKGFSAFYVSANVKDKKSNQEKTWYRVSVGLFTTQKEADAYKKDLIARGKVPSAIVQKITN